METKSALILGFALIVATFLITQNPTKVDISEISPNVYVQPAPQEQTLSVSGSASRTVEPDIGILQIRIEVTRDSANDAEERASELANQLINSIKSKGVSDNEIKTTEYRLNPRYNSVEVCLAGRCRYEQEIEGYEAIYRIQVKTKKINKLGEIIDDATNIGKDEVFVENIYFELSTDLRESIETELLEEAGRNAKAKAENILRGTGGRLGKPLRISESFYYPYYRGDFYKATALVAESAPAPIERGEMEIKVTVNVGFEIKE